LPELKLSLETGALIGARSVAKNVLEVLAGDPKWTPDRYGLHEPLRNRYQSESASTFIDAWVAANVTNGRLASFHFSKRKVYDAAAIWAPSGDETNSLYFTIQGKTSDEDWVHDCLRFSEILFTAVEGQYGHLCLREEYCSKNMTGFWTGPTGAPEGGRAHGTDRKKHLPGVYWANFFGPVYDDFFGCDRLESAPAYFLRQLPGRSWMLLTAANPLDWSSPQARACEKAVRDHLGDDAFFSLRTPTRETRAPVFWPR
jgi:hypothetical protein